MMDEIVRVYVPEANPQGAFLPGVPLRDLTRREYEALKPWMQRSVDAAPFYAVPGKRAKE